MSNRDSRNTYGVPRITSKSHLHPLRSAHEVADSLLATVSKLYGDKVGDDVSIAVIKARHKDTVIVLAGPPLSSDDDEKVVEILLSERGRKVVCGGTTASIVARRLGKPVQVDLNTSTPDVPPVARIEGIDLVTEGVLTLSNTLEQLRDMVTVRDLRYKVDGASSLLRLLLDADAVHFLVGTAMNPAHQNPDMPHVLALKAQIVSEIAEELRKIGKEVEVEVF